MSLLMQRLLEPFLVPLRFLNWSFLSRVSHVLPCSARIFLFIGTKCSSSPSSAEMHLVPRWSGIPREVKMVERGEIGGWFRRGFWMLCCSICWVILVCCLRIFGALPFDTSSSHHGAFSDSWQGPWYSVRINAPGVEDSEHGFSCLDGQTSSWEQLID